MVNKQGVSNVTTINFNNVDDMLRRINEELTGRGLTFCHAKHVNDVEVAIQFDIKPGQASMNNVAWIEAQGLRAEGRMSNLDEIDDALYVALDILCLQPVCKAYTIDHDTGVYALPVEPRTVIEPKKAEKTELQKQFEVECEAEFPDHFDFRLWPDGKYAEELTRYTFAGYELAHKNIAK
jgi:hypothetical protein